MEARTVRVLEFDKVRRMVAERTATTLGKRACEQLTPSANPDDVRERQRETTEARALLDAGDAPPFGGIHDVGDRIRRARAGGVLEARELLDVADTVTGARRLRVFLLERSGLAEWARRVRTFEPLERALRRCISEDGELMDRASPLLAKLRAETRRLEKSVREKLDGLVRSAAGRHALQEQWVTIRNGRYVVPVKQEARGDVPGIVHDRSATGATLFIEPMPVVELNNRRREVEADVEHEETRILKELTAGVGGESEALLATLDALAALDLIFARARLSAETGAVPPHLNTEGRVYVRRGRHPLLGEDAVPIDIWLGREHRTLVITGPNTGGKTVTLKTVGLLTLMAQAGLHVPADDGTELAVVSQIFADIGDEQSIEQSLSTFSSHMKAIARLLGAVRPGALVLLDELGAGTDPQEGAALARAILEWLTERDVLVVATTHYSELKSFAFSTPYVQNASVEFDAATLKPTYRLLIGVPGRSNAFKIGARLGLPREVLNRAEQVLTPDAVQADELIEGLQRDRLRAADERAEQERLRNRLEAALEGAESTRRKLQRDVGEIVAQTRREADATLRQMRRELERVTGELRRLEQAKKAASSSAGHIWRDVQNIRDHLGAWADQAETRARAETAGDRPAPTDGGPGRNAPTSAVAEPERRDVAEGDWVLVERLGQEGEVIDLSGGSAVVRVGTVRVHARPAELRRLARRPRNERAGGNGGEGEHISPDAGAAAALSREKARHVAAEIDLRGLTVDEGMAAVDKYLDDATLGGLDSVRVIHGKGTGALRNGVRTYLSAHPAVVEALPGVPGEGGDGVTVARLKPPTGSPH